MKAVISNPVQENRLINVSAEIQAELEECRALFHETIDPLTEEDWRCQSLNPGWSNHELIAHMLFGFIILKALIPMVRVWGRLPIGSSRPFARLLNVVTVPFNWINRLGARMQGRLFTTKRIVRMFDKVLDALIHSAGKIREEEWIRGMYYPTRWDANFKEFMSLEDVFHYPAIHFRFHLGQLAK